MTSLNIKGSLFQLQNPVVMGILNVTPDSFYDGGKHVGVEASLFQAHKMNNEGAKLLDIGGYSSRPGAKEISTDEELNRVIPIISEIKNQLPDCIISIDTFRRKVAENAVAAGANMVNDISGGELDPTMFDFIVESKIPYVMMHMKGNPISMQNQVHYENLLGEMLDYFANKIERFKEKGVSDVIIDPGFGFAKTLDQNYEILKNLDLFKVLKRSILVGVSRKSMIYKTLNIESKDALAGTIALNMFSLQKGASILRVHDVKEAVQTVQLYNKLS